MLKVLLASDNLSHGIGGASEVLIKTNKWLNKHNITTRVLSLYEGYNFYE
jgi:hypothetical protein|tara:strand:+ start:630 stop:779 length:150 start_codon:yes stop_codon:yes gene_type:complete